jgi:hypothetical protein
MSAAAASGTKPVVHAVHENPEWFGVFAEAFEAEGVPYSELVLTGGVLDLDDPPPPGIVWSRFSASSHTRGHGLSKEHTRAVLAWAEAGGRRVVNGRGVLELEVSKVLQLSALRAAGIAVPRTRVVVGTAHLLAAARDFPTPFVTKHNQGGKGLGVQRFDHVDELAAVLAAGGFEEPVDGVTLLQEYVQPRDGSITRVEIVGGEHLYSVRADTLRGGFQLCPADACAVDPTTGRPVLPPGATLAPEPGVSLFSLREDLDPGDRREVPRVHPCARDRDRRDRAHRVRRRAGAHLRRQHEHQLQPAGRGRRAPQRSAGGGAVPGAGAEGGDRTGLRVGTVNRSAPYLHFSRKCK